MMRSGSVKIRKLSESCDLLVMEGLKVISPFRCFLMRAFFSSLLCVNVSSSLFGVVLGLNVGFRLSRMRFALFAHLSGFLHPISLLSTQA